MKAVDKVCRGSRFVGKRRECEDFLRACIAECRTQRTSVDHGTSHAAHCADHEHLLADRYVLRPRPWCPPRPPHASPRAARSSARTCAASAALAQNLPPASRAMRARSARARATSELLRPLLHACDRRHEWRGLGASLARTRAHCSVVAARSRLRIPRKAV